MEEAAVELATPTTPSNIKTFHLTEMKVKEEEEVLAKISNRDNATPPTRHKTTSNNSGSAILHYLP